MAGIFAFSARSKGASSQDSGQVGMLFGNIFVQDFEEWDTQKQRAFVEKISYPVRKAAHATEYAVLGMLLAGAAYQKKMPARRLMLLSWGIGTGYAATDEIHQLFVPGRSGQLSDVLLDSCGVMAGAAVAVVAIYFFWNFRHLEKNV